MKRSLLKILSAILIAGIVTGCGKSTGLETKRTVPKETKYLEQESVQAVESKADKSKTEDNSGRISFIGVGDNLIHTTVYEEADKYAGTQGDGKYDFSPMYSEVKELIEGNDIAFINQETVLGGYDLGLSGYPTFNSPAEIAQNIKDVGFNLVNTATNHALDKGQQGIDNELAALDKAGLVHAGVADSQQTYDSIPVFEKKGVKFSFLAYTYGTNGIDPPNSYSIHYFDDETITSDVKKAKEISDVVIVSAHWGEENIDYATDTQEHYAQLFADLGVDVVIGTHPHVIQPIKWYNGKDGNKTLVVYSLGNFLGGMLDINNTVSGAVRFDFVKGDSGVSVENVKWIPLVIHFETQGGDIMTGRTNYKIYPLSKYTEELAKKHSLNGYEGQTVTVDYYKEHTKKVIGNEFYSE